MADEKKRANVTLTPGSSLSVRSADKGEQPLVTEGVFRGYVSLGGDQALSIELDDKGNKDLKGRIRFVPCAAILSVDILNHVKPEEEKRSSEAPQVYFG